LQACRRRATHPQPVKLTYPRQPAVTLVRIEPVLHVALTANFQLTALAGEQSCSWKLSSAAAAASYIESACISTECRQSRQLKLCSVSDISPFICHNLSTPVNKAQT